MSTDSARYHELVIEGPKGWTIGFIEGFLGAQDETRLILDAEAEGFHTSLRERIQEVLHPGAEIIHLLVPEELMALVEEAVKEAARRGAGVEVRHQRPIALARFTFSLAVYSRKEARRIRALFERLPAGLRLTPGTRFDEVTDPGAKGMEAYAPAHDFELKGHGGVEGPVDLLIALYRQCRVEELVKVDKAELVGEEETGA